MQLISTLALATSAAALVAPAAPKASTKLDVATLKNPSSTEFAYGLPGNEIPGVPSSRFDFDPLGFVERASPAEMVKYREAELKHGRVAMLAITGMLFAEVWHPMLYAPSNVPAIFAFQGTLQQSSILAPVLLAIGAVETASFPGWEPTDFKMKDGYVPGSRATAHKSKFRDLHAIDATPARQRCGQHPIDAHRYANIEGLSPWTKDKLSPEEYLRKEVVELNNGRLAMLACIGLWAQELVQHGQPVMFTLLEKVATYEIPALFQEFHQ